MKTTRLQFQISNGELILNFELEMPWKEWTEGLSEPRNIEQTEQNIASF